MRALTILFEGFLISSLEKNQQLCFNNAELHSSRVRDRLGNPHEAMREIVPLVPYSWTSV